MYQSSMFAAYRPRRRGWRVEQIAVAHELCRAAITSLVTMAMLTA